VDRYDVRMRGLDPTIGRWISRDPWGFYGGLNLYRYCYGDPINLIDATGAQPIGTVSDPGPIGSQESQYFFKS
jgi:uncharacterized protein RhaS with RHS repeats